LDQDKKLSYNLNAVTDVHSGDDIAGPNCTVCHSSYFQGKLVQGLGRANHFIGADASGFSLNVLGIGIDSLLTGDTGKQLDDGLTLLARLFQDAAGHDHLFDIFAAFAMRHDPATLKWTGNLDGDPNSGMKGWIDFPAWWHMKKKNALYANGSGRGFKSDHIMVQNWFSLDGIPEAQQVLNNFIHVQKWIEDDITAPKFVDFGGKIDSTLAATGEAVFNKNCAVCHGTYAANDADETYPNFIIDINEVGTDPHLATNHWIYPVKTWYDRSWYAQLKTSHIEKTNGYMPPPLDGVWITAPYFHNGSVPTLEGVIDSSKRPATWTSTLTDDDYDWDAVGWKNTPGQIQAFSLDSYSAIKLGGGTYDTTEVGNSNQGHTYGDPLSADEKRALLEYLKTL
jgi:mono/diheme cytochrome c family protein